MLRQVLQGSWHFRHSFMSGLDALTPGKYGFVQVTVHSLVYWFKYKDEFTHDEHYYEVERQDKHK